MSVRRNDRKTCLQLSGSTTEAQLMRHMLLDDVSDDHNGSKRERRSGESERLEQGSEQRRASVHTDRRDSIQVRKLAPGPTTRQAEKLFEICGHNEVARKEKRAAVVKSVLQFKNPLVLILLFVARATTATVLRDNVKKQARSQIDPEY